MSVKSAPRQQAAGARAEALRDLGYQAFRLGRAGRARQLFERALPLFGEAYGHAHAQTATALSDLGVAESALGEEAAARQHHEAALAIRRSVLGTSHADVAASLHNLAVVCRNLRDFEAAEAGHREALAIWRELLGPAHPAVARALTGLGVVAAKRGDQQAALQHHRQALKIRQSVRPLPVPEIVTSLTDIGDCLAAAGNFAAAEAEWRLALSLQQGLHGENSAPLAPALNRLGVARRLQGDADGAIDWFEKALDADADFVLARHSLAVLLARQGRPLDAALHRERALKQQRVFVQRAANERCRVLILAGADEGNIPLEHLLPEAQVTRIWWFVEHSADPLAERLPDHDVAFYGIGDPDMAGGAERKAAAFLGQCRKPVLNHPAQVLNTRRDLLPAALSGIPNLIVPRTIRLSSGNIAEQADAAGLRMPLLLRPAGSHGGKSVILARDRDMLDQALPHDAAAWYATEFFDCRAADGTFRKYRVIFVNREPCAYHLAISDRWLVHYFSADMAGHAWKLAEEAAFLADWRSALGDRAADAIAEVGQRLELDYCGIDFGRTEDGRPVVFEANATMLVHPEADDGPLAFKNRNVTQIVFAMQKLLTEKAAFL
jgi:tetratricopeptide (TPR) repeat protein